MPIIERARTIIVVEDDQSIAELIAWALGDAGFVVHTMATVSGALRLCESLEPDLVVADFMLPDGVGSDLLTHLRDRTGSRRPPVMMISAHPAAIELARGAGADACLAKPFDLDDLFDTVDRLVCQPEPTAA